MCFVAAAFNVHWVFLIDKFLLNSNSLKRSNAQNIFFCLKNEIVFLVPLTIFVRKLWFFFVRLKVLSDLTLYCPSGSPTRQPCVLRGGLVDDGLGRPLHGQRRRRRRTCPVRRLDCEVRHFEEIIIFFVFTQKHVGCKFFGKVFGLKGFRD